LCLAEPPLWAVRVATTIPFLFFFKKTGIQVFSIIFVKENKNI